MLQCTSTSPLPFFSVTTHKKSLLFRLLSFLSCVGPFFSFIKLHFDCFYRKTMTTPRPKKILHNELVAKAMSSVSPPSTPLPSTPGSIRSEVYPQVLALLLFGFLQSSGRLKSWRCCSRSTIPRPSYSKTRTRIVMSSQILADQITSCWREEGLTAVLYPIME